MCLPWLWRAGTGRRGVLDRRLARRVGSACGSSRVGGCRPVFGYIYFPRKLYVGLSTKNTGCVLRLAAADAFCVPMRKTELAPTA
jgi:hypothetical protein